MPIGSTTYGIFARRHANATAGPRKSYKPKMCATSKSRSLARNLSTDLAEVPIAELEPRGTALLPGEAAGFRRRAHFWLVRFSGTGGGVGVPARENSVCCGTDWHVCADRAEYLAEAPLSLDLGKKTVAWRRSDHYYGRAGDRRTCCRRHSRGKNRTAQKRDRTTGGASSTRSISRGAPDS